MVEPRRVAPDDNASRGPTTATGEADDCAIPQWRTVGMYINPWPRGTAVGFKKYGSEEELSWNPVKHLTDTYPIPILLS
ncbi:hypothetical protein Pelo_16824 [Pelomyxa schiedti]|nr:hypothetical protein Pelo_16824 [Pelomyxa schiedti]